MSDIIKVCKTHGELKAEASISAKICEGVISSLKTELEYHRLLNQKPLIKFLEGTSILMDSKPKLLK